MPEVRLTAQARADVELTVSWLRDRDPVAAARWHAALMEKVLALDERPDRYPLAHEAQELGFELREMQFGKRRRIFRILFTIQGNVVFVHRIRDAARDWLRPGEIDLI